MTDLTQWITYSSNGNNGFGGKMRFQIYLNLILFLIVSTASAVESENFLPKRTEDLNCEIVTRSMFHNRFYKLKLWNQENKFESLEWLSGVLSPIRVEGTFTTEPNGENHSTIELSSKTVLMPGIKEKRKSYSAQVEQSPLTLPYTYTTLYLNKEALIGLIHYERHIRLRSELEGHVITSYGHGPRTVNCKRPENN